MPPSFFTRQVARQSAMDAASRESIQHPYIQSPAQILNLSDRRGYVRSPGDVYGQAVRAASAPTWGPPEPAAFRPVVAGSGDTGAPTMTQGSLIGTLLTLGVVGGLFW